MKKLLLLIGVMCTILTTQSQIPKALPNTYVNDLIGKLSKDQIYTLNDSILALEKRTSVQIAILMVPELPPNTDIDDYTRNVGNTWGVGKAKNGVMYVLSLKERAVRIEPAGHAQGALPDVVCNAIIGGMKPFFHRQDYYGAMQYLVAQIASNVDPTTQEQLATKKNIDMQEKAVKHDSFMNLFTWIILITLILACIGIVFFHYINKIRLKTKEEEKEKQRQLTIAANNYAHHKHRSAGYGGHMMPLSSKKLTKGSKGASHEREEKEESDDSSLLTGLVVGSALSSSNNDDDDDDNSSSSSSSSSSDDSPSFGDFGGFGGGDFDGAGSSGSMD